MKTQNLQKEVLVFMSSSFSNRELSDGQAPLNNKHPLSRREQIKEACWNGLIAEMLPEIFEDIEAGQKLFLWQVYESTSFIALEMADQDFKPEAAYSISPILFKDEINYN